MYAVIKIHMFCSIVRWRPLPVNYCDSLVAIKILNKNTVYPSRSHNYKATVGCKCVHWASILGAYSSESNVNFKEVANCCGWKLYTFSRKLNCKTLQTIREMLCYCLIDLKWNFHSDQTAAFVFCFVLFCLFCFRFINMRSFSRANFFTRFVSFPFQYTLWTSQMNE